MVTLFVHKLTPQNSNSQADWVLMLKRTQSKKVVWYLLLLPDGTTAWYRDIPHAEHFWRKRHDLSHIDTFEYVRYVDVPGDDSKVLQVRDGKGVWHPIHKPKEDLLNVALMLAIRWLEKKPEWLKEEPDKSVRVPGISRVRVRVRDDGKQVRECQHDSDKTGDYYEFDYEVEAGCPIAAALAKCQTDGKGVEIAGGSWGGVASLPDHSPKGGSDGRSVMSSQLLTSIAAPRVSHQSKVDGCVPNALCNSTILSDKERAIIINDMPPRFCIENIQPFFSEHRIPLQLHAPKTWYTEYKSDQRLLKLLSYLLLETTRGHYIVNVKEVDGGEQHYLLFDCDGRWVYDSDPRFGEHALPLTQATMELMGVARVLKAGKLVPQRSSVHRNMKLNL